MVFELIADYLVGERNLYNCYLVLFELVGRLFLTCVYIDGMLYVCHDARYRLGTKLEEEVLSLEELIIIHPEYCSCDG